MYSIGTIIYGIPINEAISARIRAWEEGLDGEGNDLPDDGEERWFEDNEGTCGFTTQYHGSADGLVGFCGVELCQMNESKDVNVKDLILVPTPKQIKEAEEKLALLHSELRALGDEVGVYIIWSTS